MQQEYICKENFVFMNVKIMRAGRMSMCSDGENESFNVDSIKNDILVKKVSISTQNYKIIYIQAQPLKMFFPLNKPNCCRYILKGILWGGKQSIFYITTIILNPYTSKQASAC
jgi:hypothetical protein